MLILFIVYFVGLNIVAHCIVALVIYLFFKEHQAESFAPASFPANHWGYGWRAYWPVRPIQR